MSAANNPNDARGPAQISPIPPRHSSTTTTAAGSNSASGGTSSPNAQPEPASTQIATQSVAAPNNNGTASTTTNNAAAAADTSRNNANSGVIDMSGTEEGEDVFAALKEKQEREFSICKIWKHTKGRSDVYNHMHQIAIDASKVSKIYSDDNINNDVPSILYYIYTNTHTLTDIYFLCTSYVRLRQTLPLLTLLNQVRD